jgi:hypothetical protein
MAGTNNVRPQRQETPTPRRNAGTLTHYYQVLSTGDEPSWELAFKNTWHPEAIVHGRTCAELKARHRAMLGKGWVEDVHVIRDIDDDALEFTIRVGERHEGPFWATFKDGRIYRVL